MRPEFIAGTATRVGQNRAVPMREAGARGYAATAMRPGHVTRPRGHAATAGAMRPWPIQPAATDWICLGWAGTGVACRAAARQEEI
jgi:hypothetical protein